MHLNENDILQGIRNGDRVILSRAITLAESQKPEHRSLIHNSLGELLKKKKKSLRIGITGVPGVGKSTFIEKFGKFLTGNGHKVAVLTIDPSSKESGGSILGDKTRMNELALDKNAFIRPSPAGENLGGVARKTREAMLLCEAAGFDVILVETVGVGQSETTVRDMVDVFLLLMLAGAGDELQGMKKGIMESADILAINKSDGTNEKASKEARMEYLRALQLFPAKKSSWKTQVLCISSITGMGMEALWDNFQDCMKLSEESGYFEENRKEQMVKWFEEELSALLQYEFFKTSNIQSEFEISKQGVRNGNSLPFEAAEMLLKKFIEHYSKS